MGIANYISGMAGQQLKNWFTDISQKLGDSNYGHGQFTPNITNLTGTPTITGNWFRISRFMHVTVVVNGTSQTALSAIDNLPFKIINYGILTVYNNTNSVLIGHGDFDVAFNNAFLPNWNVTNNNLTIQGNYQIVGL